MYRTQVIKQIYYNSFIPQIYLFSFHRWCETIKTFFCFALKNYTIDISPFMTYYGMVFKETAIQTFHLKREKKTAFRKY